MALLHLGFGDSGTPPVRGKGIAHLVNDAQLYFLFSCLIVRTSGHMERSPLCLLIAYPTNLTLIG